MLDIEGLKGRYFKKHDLWAVIVGGYIAVDTSGYGSVPRHTLTIIGLTQEGTTCTDTFPIKTQKEAPHGVKWA